MKRYVAVFQSARHAWGATVDREAADREQDVSIHAPRVGRDPMLLPNKTYDRLFQSARPAWGATWSPPYCPPPSKSFQSARPARGAISTCSTLQTTPSSSNPRAPRGARQCGSGICGHWNLFQPTRPAWGATPHGRRRCPRPSRFNPRAPSRTRPAMSCQTAIGSFFQSARPRRGARLSIMQIDALPFQYYSVIIVQFR